MSLKRVTLNGTVYNPSKVETTVDKIGEVKVMINGTTRFFHKAHKRKWSISWEGIPDATVQALRTIYLLTTSFTFKDEWDTSYTVLCLPGGFKHTLAGDRIGLNGIEYYDVSFDIQEA